MQKILWPLSVTFLLLISACHTGNNSEAGFTKNSGDNVHIFPVTSFLKGRLRVLDTMPVTPLQTITENGKIDSLWMKRADIRKYAQPFLSPLIDSSTMYPFFTEKSFLDQTINSYTFSYDPKASLPDSINLIHWDVYMNPQTNTIERIYMVKEKYENNESITTQLTWLVDKWYSIRTITQVTGKEDQVKEEKMIWDFDE